MSDASASKGAAAKLGLRLTLIVVAVILVAVPFGLLLLEVLSKGPLTRLDRRIADQQNTDNLHSANRVHIAELVSKLGSTLVLVTVVLGVAVFLALFRRRRRQALFLVTTAVLGVAANNVIKKLVGRSRPHFTHAAATSLGKSFPSGHSMNSAVIYGSVLLLAWPWLRTAGRRWVAGLSTSLLVIAIAASRVVLGVHYLSDVVAGVALGAAFVLASAAVFKTWEHEGGRLPAAIENAPTVGDAGARDSSKI